MSLFKKIGSWIRAHFTLHHITDKISELLIWWITLTRFYIRWKNWFTWEKINRLQPYEILKFFSWIVYLYLQVSRLIYFIDQETIYYLWKLYDIVMHVPSPFNAFDPKQAGFLYILSQVFYWWAYGIRSLEILR